jgi:hypothetical protein
MYLGSISDDHNHHHAITIAGKYTSDKRQKTEV